MLFRSLDMRDGECHLTDSKGPVEIDEARAEVTLANHNGPVRIGGNDGRITVTNPLTETKVDARRAEVEARLLQAVPLTLLTTDDPLRVVLDGPLHVTIDAVATMGRVQATDFDLSPENVEHDSHLSHAIGGRGGARVSLRNLRGDIVIKNLRGPVVNPNRK